MSATSTRDIAGQSAYAPTQVQDAFSLSIFMIEDVCSVSNLLLSLKISVQKLQLSCSYTALLVLWRWTSFKLWTTKETTETSDKIVAFVI